MYTPEFLEKKKKKLSRISLFAIIVTVISLIIPNARKHWTQTLDGIILDVWYVYEFFLVDLFNLITTGQLKIFDSIPFYIQLIFSILPIILFLFSLLRIKPSIKLKFMNVGFFPLILVYAQIVDIIFNLLNSFKGYDIFEGNIMFLIFILTMLILYLPLLISYLRTRKYFVKRRKAVKEVEKENTRIEKNNVVESKKQRRIKTTVTRDKEICIHIEFV